MRRFLLSVAILVALVLSGCGNDEDGPTGGDDSIPPLISLTEPADSVEITPPRSIDFSATATDNVGVRLVVFYFDGEIVGQDVVGASNVFTCHWDSEPLSLGSHVAIAEAIDWASLKDRDTSIVIIVPDSSLVASE